MTCQTIKKNPLEGTGFIKQQIDVKCEFGIVLKFGFIINGFIHSVILSSFLDSIFTKLLM